MPLVAYYGQLDVEREDCNDEVLDPLFEAWFDLAVVRFGWLGGAPEAISRNAKAHLWDWPAHAVADIQTEANANKTKLGTGEISLDELYTKDGRDFEDALPKMAATYGVTEDEMREILRTAIFNAQGQQASAEAAEAQTTNAEKPPAAPAKPATKPAPAEAALPINRLLKVNGGANGHAIHQ
jgi:plasmid stability protein